MSNCQAPIEHRFSATNQPKHRVKRGASPFTTIKKYLTKKITCANPITQEQGKLAVGEVIGLQWLIKAFKGDSEAIKDLLDRIDGKTIQKLIGEGFGSDTKIIIVRPQEKENGTPTESIPRQVSL